MIFRFEVNLERHSSNEDVAELMHGFANAIVELPTIANTEFLTELTHQKTREVSVRAETFDEPFKQREVDGTLFAKATFDGALIEKVAQQ